MGRPKQDKSKINSILNKVSKKSDTKKLSYKKCPHGKAKYYCTGCGGSGICSHLKRKYDCIICHPKGFCIHSRHKARCSICNCTKSKSKVNKDKITKSKKAITPFKPEFVSVPTHVPHYIPAHVPSHISPIHVPAYVPAYIPTHIPAHIPNHIPAEHLPIHVPAHVPGPVPAYIPEYVPAHVPIRIPADSHEQKIKESSQVENHVPLFGKVRKFITFGSVESITKESQLVPEKSSTLNSSDNQDYDISELLEILESIS